MSRPGITAFPDWFSQNITSFYNNEFAVMFNRQSGVDIDGLWIDMNVSDPTSTNWRTLEN